MCVCACLCACMRPCERVCLYVCVCEAACSRLNMHLISLTVTNVACYGYALGLASATARSWNVKCDANNTEQI